MPLSPPLLPRSAVLSRERWSLAFYSREGAVACIPTLLT